MVDYAGYDTQRRNINTDYAAKTAAGDYGRFVAQQRGSRQVGDLSQQFQRGYPKLAADWGARGQTGPRVQSGFYQQAMQQYLGDQQQSQARLGQDLANEQNGMQLSQAGLDAERARALADLEMQKQREIAALAQNIAAVRPSI